MHRHRTTGIEELVQEVDEVGQDALEVSADGIDEADGAVDEVGIDAAALLQAADGEGRPRRRSWFRLLFDCLMRFC
jgi:hypothetical protein